MAYAEPATHRRRQMTIRLSFMALALLLLGVLASMSFSRVPAGHFSLQSTYSNLDFAMRSIAAEEKPSDCEIDVKLDSDMKAYLQPNFAILIGEMHGTKESPQFAQAIACAALRADRKVTIALEIPNNAINLSDRSFWADSYQDGRRSGAMHDLIEKLQSWRNNNNYPIRLLAIDEPSSHGEQREEAMAENLAKDIRKNTQDVYIVLTGNIHSRLSQGTAWDNNYSPMGLTLKQKLAKDTNASIVSLEPRYYAGGEAYICTGDDPSSCKVTKFNKFGGVEPKGLADRGVDIRQTEQNVYQGFYYFTNPVMPSEPAFPRTASVASR